MYNQLVRFIEAFVDMDSDLTWLLLVVTNEAAEFVCCNKSTNFALSTVVEPSNACATSGKICIVIMGTDVPDADEDGASVPVEMRVNGETANKSWALFKLIVTRLLLFASNRVVVGICFISALDMLILFGATFVSGKCVDFEHAWLTNISSKWCFLSDRLCTERHRFRSCSTNCFSSLWKRKRIN